MSRNPARIEPTLKFIQKIWEHYPDMRLSQLLLNTGMNYNTEENELLNNMYDLYVSGNIKEEED